VPYPAPHRRRPHPPPAPQPLSWLERGRRSPRLVGGLLRTGHRRHHGTTHPHRPTAQQARQIQQDPPPPALHGRRGSGTRGLPRRRGPGAVSSRARLSSFTPYGGKRRRGGADNRGGDTKRKAAVFSSFPAPGNPSPRAAFGLPPPALMWARGPAPPPPCACSSSSAVAAHGHEGQVKDQRRRRAGQPLPPRLLPHHSSG